MEKLIFLCRHLPTEANRKGIVMGRKVNVPIVETAILPYKGALVDFDKRYGVRGLKSQIYSSPLLRCRQTGEIVRSELLGEAEIQIDERLNETDCGDFAGFSGEQLRKTHPELVDTWMQNPQEMRFPNGESYQEVQARSMAWLKEVLMIDCDVIFAFTHVDVIKMVLFGILSIPISKKRKLDIKTGSIAVISHIKNESVVKGINVVSI